MSMMLVLVALILLTPVGRLVIRVRLVQIILLMAFLEAPLLYLGSRRLWIAG